MLENAVNVLALALAFFVLLNVLARLAFPRASAWLSRKTELGYALDDLRADPEARDRVHEWYGLSKEQYAEYMREQTKRIKASEVHEPFVEFRMKAFAGKYFQIAGPGFRVGRDQGPWPPTAKHYNIFFYGGSTALHPGAGWQSVASRLQECLNSEHGKEVRVYNFGCSAYFSTQEKILHSKLLAEGFRPDMALFFHGLNDYYMFEGLPATYGCFQEALGEKSRIERERSANRNFAAPQWGALRRFFQSLPFPLLLERAMQALVMKKAAGQTAYHTDVALDRAVYEKVSRRLVHNQREIEAVSEAFGVRAVFALQPVPGYNYDLRHHAPYQILKKAGHGLMGQERSGRGYPVLFEIMAEQGLERPNFISLADMQQDRAENLYLDSCHYTAAFAQDIARALASELVQRGLLQPGPSALPGQQP
ncbi:MAG: SGNH/GDSL hydrolase family protein [Desulfovibrionaceae bacterium]|nr:SGNH/GDSL hydrolase family protein [Desulfovibrionaceae bacterium]